MHAYISVVSFSETLLARTKDAPVIRETHLNIHKHIYMYVQLIRQLSDKLLVADSNKSFL